MSEPKTAPTDANVQEFLDAAATARRREEGLRLAEIFGEVTGTDPVMWGPTMVGYGSFRYISRANPRTRGDWFKTGFSPRKAQLTFYGLSDSPEATALLPKLGTYTQSVSCVYAKKLGDVDLDVLRQLIAIAWERGDDPEPS
jgi:hypothetical protein